MGVTGRLVNLQLGSKVPSPLAPPTGLGSSGGFRLSTTALASGAAVGGEEGHTSPAMAGREGELQYDQLTGGQPSSPPIIARTKEEKAANPERLNLDRRKCASASPRYYYYVL
jgi:hypothetical protein